MRRILWVIFSFCLVLNIKAADILDNPKNPVPGKGKKIDRIIKMTEVYRITDKEENFFFKRPSNIHVASDGSLLLMDAAQKQLLKFNADGKFMSSLAMHGEGPRELRNMSSLWLDGDNIIVASYMPVKIICMDSQWNLVKEIKVNTNEYMFYFLGRFGGKYYFNVDPDLGEEGLLTPLNRLVYADETGAITETSLTLPVKRVEISYLEQKVKQNTIISTKRANITHFNYAIIADRYLYVTTSERYLIQVYDFQEKKVIQTFRRQYQPVAYKPNPSDEFVNSSKFKAICQRKFYNDVYRLLAVTDQIWALTSTVDKTKGVLVDVFNKDGQYIDRFYLKIPNLLYPDDKLVDNLYYKNGFLYAIRIDDEDNPYIIKYKLDE